MSHPQANHGNTQSVGARTELEGKLFRVQVGNVVGGAHDVGDEVADEDAARQNEAGQHFDGGVPQREDGQEVPAVDVVHKLDRAGHDEAKDGWQDVGNGEAHGLANLWSDSRTTRPR